MSLFRPRKPFMSTFRISYFPHSLHGRLLASSARPMLFARKSYGFRPQDLWFSSPRPMVLEPKSAFRAGQNLWSWGPKAPSDGGKSGWGRACVVGCFNSD